MKPGDSLHLTDGVGLLCAARIMDANPKACSLEIVSSEQESIREKFHLHLAVAPTKNIGRFEWFLEKATEIGIDEITPIICKNSERKTVNTARLRKVLVAAMKQSLKPFLPTLNEAVTFENFMSKARNGNGFIAYVSNEHRDQLKESYISGTDGTILIGPEGDFTEEEVQLALAKGFKAVSLGKSRLRTETAAVVACHTVQLINDQT